jgi:two-component system cell cycle response regulator
VLQQFAELLVLNRKVTDQVFRYGGDEFMVLTPLTPRHGALAYAENLRNKIAATKFKVHGGRPDVSLTISAGIADMKYPDKDTCDDLLKRATEALSRAKKARNSVELYQSPIEIPIG